MSSVIEAPKIGQTTAQPWFRWLPIVAGLLVMYVPSYLDLSRTFWETEVGGHGPIILAVVVWLFWRQRQILLEPAQGRMPKTGWALIIFGLVSYILGRSQEFFQLEVGSQIPLLLGIVLALQGKKAAKSLWFPIFFLCFLVPIPGSVLDFLLLPLKKYVSIIVENLLYLFGYPIGRTGVVLTIGPYQLLIADACSGLNSMIALSAVGVLFAYLINSDSRAYNAILLASILPIAFLANIVRVTLLMLVTYYFGDHAGQQFHDYAGYMEIVFAFGVFFALDAILQRLFPRRNPASLKPAGTAA